MTTFKTESILASQIKIEKMTVIEANDGQKSPGQVFISATTQWNA